MTQKTTFTRSILALIASALLAALPAASHAQCAQQQAKLLASDGAMSDEFGISVSISGDVAIVGADGNDDNGLQSGSAYISRFDGTTWSQDQKLLASDGAAGDRFGFSVSIGGDMAIVGAFLDDDNGTDSGSVYVFRFDGTTWSQEQKLLASDGARGDGFGISVSIGGDVAIVGASGDGDNGINSGSAYIFRFDGTTWTQEQKLLASDGASGDSFGYSVSISGDVAIVGAGGDDDNGTGSGSAYVFRLDGTTWNQEQKLIASDGAGGDSFGFSVSIGGDVAIVGAGLSDSGAGIDAGSAYIYRFDATTWNQEQKLLASDGSAADDFGNSVSISGDVAIVGARGADGITSHSGSAYIFRFDATTWNQEQKLLASDGAAGDLFGSSVAISGNMAIVGAPFDDDNAGDSGSAYTFTGLAACPVDLTGDCQTDVLDFFVFVGLFGTDDPRADLNGDGSVSVLDFFVFVAAFAAGCP